MQVSSNYTQMYYINLDPRSQKTQNTLTINFISQGFLDITQKLQNLDQEAQGPFSTLLDMAFKVFNN